MRNHVIPVFFDEKTASSAQYSNTIQGIRGAASRSGFRMKLISDRVTDETDFDSLPPVAIITGVDMPYMQSVIEKLRNHNRRAVLAGVDSEPFGHDMSCATPSRRTETQQLVNYLYNAGRSRIALVGFDVNSIHDNFRYHAAMSAAAAWGHPLTDHPEWQWEHDPRPGFEAFLKESEQYDAVICPNDIIAICFIRTAREKGVSVPGDLFVASFGNFSVGRCFSPSITTVSMDMVCVGEQALQVWRYLMASDNPTQNAIKITVPSRILVRESTAGIEIGDGQGLVARALVADRFYYNSAVSVLQNLENCLGQRDEMDMGILCSLMAGMSYESIAEERFISVSTLRYRLNKIFADAGVRTRQEFEQLVHENLGSGNPFQLT